MPRPGGSCEALPSIDFWEGDQGLVTPGASQATDQKMRLGTGDVPQDLIQFGCAIKYCIEGEGEVKLEVMRLGDASGRASVEYRTHEGSAKAGRKFVAKHGGVDFLPGETRKVFSIQIVEDDAFDTTLEFEVVLSNARGAVLEPYLNRCLVLIADDDAFPTNRFAGLLQQENITHDHVKSIPPWPLMMEYFKLCMHDKSFRHRSGLHVLCDQCHNFGYIYAVLMTNFIIDEVLRPPPGKEPPRNPLELIWICVGISGVPLILSYFIERWNAMRRLKGHAISMLQGNLLRKYIYYNEASRSMVSTSDLTMAISRDIPELVEEGFLPCFALAREFGLLVLLSVLGFNQLRQVDFWFLVILFVGFPCVMLAFLALRHPGTASRRQSLFREQTGLVGFVQKTTECYRIITDYYQRPKIVVGFQERVALCNKAATRSLLWEISNKHFGPFITAVVCGCYILVSAPKVLADAPIGEFVTGIALCKGIGLCYQNIYKNVLRMQQAIAPLQNVVYFMNLTVDVTLRMERSRAILEQARLEQEASESRYNTCSPASRTKKTSLDLAFPRRLEGVSSRSYMGRITPFSTDSLCISGKDVSFSYTTVAGTAVHVLRNASFTIPQGRLVAVTGPPAGGKGTLLQLIAGVLLPCVTDTSTDVSGGLFVPPHLRVLHVGYQPEIICDLDLYENLCFGPSEGHDEDPARIVKICRRLGMSADVLRLVAAEASQSTGAPVMTSEASHAASQLMNRASSAHNVFVGRVASVKTSHVSPTSIAAGVLKAEGGVLMSRQKTVDQLANEGTLLSYTDKCLIHIARAFIMNPDVLIIHKPLEHFDDLHSLHVLELMREFVSSSGVERPPHDNPLYRHPRTCIFTASSTKSIESADLVLHVARQKVRGVNQESLDLVRVNATRLFKALDVDRNNQVTRVEFVNVVSHEPWAAELLGLSGTGRAVEERVGLIFDKLDMSQCGSVSYDDIERFLRGRVDADLPDVLSAMMRIQAEASASIASTSRAASQEATPIAREAQEPQEPPETPAFDDAADIACEVPLESKLDARIGPTDASLACVRPPVDARIGPTAGTLASRRPGFPSEPTLVRQMSRV